MDKFGLDSKSKLGLKPKQRPEESMTSQEKLSVQYNWLGSSGLKVSNICLGTMTFGVHPQGRPYCTEEEAHKMLDRFVELGGNFIDTADVYQIGVTETIVGNWLKKQERDRLIIATKVGKMIDKNDPNYIGLSRYHIMRSIEKSLQRLQTDYIDLYYAHLWDDGTPVEETWAAMNDLVRQGKVRYLGISNCKGWQLQKVVEVSKQHGWDKIVALQQQYSLLCRSPELELMDVCRNEGIACLPWGALKGGWLSGKMKRESGAAPPDSRVEWSAGRAHHSHPDWAWFADNVNVWTILETVQKIADSLGRSVPQVALRWALQRPCVPSVLIGARTLAQFDDNMSAAVGWKLSDEQLDELNSVSSIAAPYPYDYTVKDNLTRQRP